MKFRKRPVEIEAMQFTRDSWDQLVEFTGGDAYGLLIPKRPQGKAVCHISTLEGDMLATEGDWVIKGVEGEFYPCKPDIFLQTYEPSKTPELASEDKLKAGAELIMEERQRQIESEGWTIEHDAQYYRGELVSAASCYLKYCHPHWAEYPPSIPVPNSWPWSQEWWKPTPENRVRELQKAGALIAAEIDRLNNLNGQAHEQQKH